MFLSGGDRSARDAKSIQMSQRFGRAIYLFILVSAVLLMVVGVFLVRDGPWNNFILGLSSDFLVVAVVFFLIEEFFHWKSQKDLLQDEKLQELDKRFQKTGETLVKIEKALLYSGVETVQEEAQHTLLKAYKSSSKSLHIISPYQLQALDDPVLNGQGYRLPWESGSDFSPIIFRQLLWWEQHLDVLQCWMAQYDIPPDVEFRFFLPPQDKYIPILPCVIIDEQVVSFGWGYLGNSIEDVSISLKQPQVTKAFFEYFASLWDKSVILKRRGEPPLTKRLQEVRERLNQFTPGYLLSSN